MDTLLLLICIQNLVEAFQKIDDEVYEKALVLIFTISNNILQFWKLFLISSSCSRYCSTTTTAN